MYVLSIARDGSKVQTHALTDVVTEITDARKHSHLTPGAGFEPATSHIEGRISTVKLWIEGAHIDTNSHCV